MTYWTLNIYFYWNIYITNNLHLFRIQYLICFLAFGNLTFDLANLLTEGSSLPEITLFITCLVNNFNKSKVFAVIFKLVKIIPFKIRSMSKNWCCFFGKLVHQSLFSLQFYLLLELGKMYYVWLSTESILIWGFRYLKVRKFLQFAQV